MRKDRADTIFRDSVSTLLTWHEQQEYCWNHRKGQGCNGCKYNLLGFCDTISTVDCLNTVATNLKSVLKEYNVELQKKDA